MQNTLPPPSPVSSHAASPSLMFPREKASFNRSMVRASAPWHSRKKSVQYNLSVSLFSSRWGSRYTTHVSPYRAAAAYMLSVSAATVRGMI